MKTSQNKQKKPNYHFSKDFMEWYNSQLSELGINRNCIVGDRKSEWTSTEEYYVINIQLVYDAFKEGKRIGKGLCK